MRICNVDGCESTNLVYSGVDAFMLECNTEEICYAHAEENAKRKH